MSEENSVKIIAAKGRPMLTWVGKRPLARAKIGVFELRTDPKHRKFIGHKPARAEVKVALKIIDMPGEEVIAAFEV